MTISLLRSAALALIAATLPLFAAKAFAADAVALFDGKTLDGWEGDGIHWKVEDGFITGESTPETKLGGNTFLIWKKGTVKDFEIEFDYRFMSKSGNSGIQYRSKDYGNHVVGGYQADMDADNAHTGINYGEKTNRGIITQRGERAWKGDGAKYNKKEQFADGNTLKALIKGTGEWNHYKVTAKGTTLTHTINGTLMSETIDESKTDAVMEGILALQLHAGPPMKIQFKEIKLTTLAP